METSFNLVCACALQRIFGDEPGIAQNIISVLGDEGAFFKLDADGRREVIGPFSKYRDKLCNPSLLDRCEKELDMLARSGCTFLSCTDDFYPEPLRECPDAPAGIYVKTQSKLEDVFGGRPFVSIVGTRDMSPYGREWCQRAVVALAQAPTVPGIVSGLAFGVDITAHMAALDNGLATIAVMPTGIDDVYPKAHRGHAARIAASPGSALITDFPPGTDPQATTFLRRNRIIAGLSGSTLLVESRIKGGGLITARHAFSYSRAVFALPGRIDDPRSAGCNLLIREQQAEMVSDVGVLSRQMGLGGYNRRRQAELEAEVRRRYCDLDGSEVQHLAMMAKQVKKNRGICVDELCRALGIPYRDAIRYAGMLESDGFISMDMLLRCSITVKNP